jgi:hypothetical protein
VPGSMRQREHLNEATAACWVAFSGEAIRPLTLFVAPQLQRLPNRPGICPVNHGTPHAIWCAKNSTDSASGPNLSMADASFNLQAHRSFLIWVNGRPRCK